MINALLAFGLMILILHKWFVSLFSWIPDLGIPHSLIPRFKNFYPFRNHQLLIVGGVKALRFQKGFTLLFQSP